MTAETSQHRLKIAVCSTAHPYDDTRVFHREAQSLAVHFDVTLYCCAPVAKKTIHDHLRVVGLRPWKRKHERFFNLFRLFGKIRHTRADLYIFHDTVGMLLVPYIKIIKKRKVVYDIHENFHGSIRDKEWIPRVLQNRLADAYIFFEKIILRFTDMIWFAVSDIGDHYPHYKKPKLLVGNFPSMALFRSVKNPQPVIKNQFIFVGSMDDERSIIQIVQAFEIFSPAFPDYRLVLAGYFYSPEYEKEVEKKVNASKFREKISLLGRIPYEDALRLIGASRAGFSLHQPIYNYIHGFPLKLLEYAGMGTPVIASDFGVFKTLVVKHNCGVNVNPNDIDAIAAAMRFIAEDPARARGMGERGKKLVEDSYNWENVSRQMISAVRELVQSP